MDRDIEKDLLVWKNQQGRLPLLLRGARQVGKSYVVEKFGQTQFEHLLIINFELQPELQDCFTGLDPNRILQSLYLLTGQKVIPGKTLLFIDEIQECPNAIRALRYFKEKMPALHVIGAGSLLEFTLNNADFRMPVGRVQFIYLKPCSFREYLSACGYSQLREYLQTVTLDAPILPAVHEELLKRVREYMVLGGMPAVLQKYIEHKDFAEVQGIHAVLLNTYQTDFGKYASRACHEDLRRLFPKIPGFVGLEFKYASIDPEMRSRDIKLALDMLGYAGLLYRVYSTSASGLPLISLINEKKFKLLFLDTGLVQRATQLSAKTLMREDILLVNRGMVAEQFVGQELLAYQSPFEEAQLFFWSRAEKSSMAEVDFVFNIQGNIVPIEIKAGSTGRLKSLKIFMQEKKINLGLRISQLPLKLENNILSLPLYMIAEIPRLVADLDG